MSKFGDYLENADLLDPCQFAYRGDHSTQTCLIRMLDDVRRSADLRMVTISVFFDFSKAFDRVDYIALLGKLKTLNFSDSVLQWIFSYLTGRIQRVRGAAGEMSSSTVIGTGVPQGSVLGPLLFTLYLSDFRRVLTHCRYNFYADDLQIYYHCKPRELLTAIQRVNNDIKSVICWATANKLVLNADKTQAIIFGITRYISMLDLCLLPNITVGMSSILYSTSVKYLGVIVTNNLSWEKQVANITGRMRSVLYRLKICRHLFHADLRHRLITSLVLPYVDYCCAALTDMTAECNLKLYRAMNQCIRFIFDIRSDIHITPYYNKLRMLKIDARRDYFIGCQLFNLLQTRRPAILADNYNFRVQCSCRATRAPSDLLELPQCRTEYYRRSFELASVRFWNSLPSACVTLRLRLILNINFMRIYSG